MIKTEKELIAYIREKLGEPLIKCELLDQHLKTNIKEAIKFFTTVTELTRVVKEVNLKEDEIDFCEIDNVYDLSNNSIPFNFNKYKRKLECNQDRVIIEGYYDYIPDEIDYIYDEIWIQRYSIALTKFQWGNVLGKFSGELVSGATIDYDSIRSQGESEIETLREELYEKWSNPAPFVIS